MQTELVKRGFDVATPFSDNCKYDLVLDRDGELERVQIKTGRYREGTVVFNAYSWQAECETQHQTYEGDVDSFMVYCHETDQIYYLKMDEITTNNSMRLRVEEAERDLSSINWAEEHELDRKI